VHISCAMLALLALTPLSGLDMITNFNFMDGQDAWFLKGKLFPAPDSAPVCECEVFTNNLTQFDIGMLGCARKENHGPKGAERLWCEKPVANFVPGAKISACPANMWPCKVAYKKVPDPYPFCACSSFENGAASKDPFTCQMNYNPPPPPPPPPPSHPTYKYHHRSLFNEAPSEAMVEQPAVPSMYSAYPLTATGKCLNPNPNQIPTKVGILHDLGCPHNTFFCQKPVTIGELAATVPQLSTLLSLLKLVGLAGLVSDPSAGPFTVFAPTNEAFDALPPAVLEDITAKQCEPDVAAGTCLLPAEQYPILTAILLYHVLPGVVPSNEFKGDKTFKTVEGQNVRGTLRLGPTGLVNEVNFVPFVIPDVLAVNGVVQVIGTVLSPINMMQLVKLEPELSTLAGLLELTGLDATLSDVDKSYTLFAPTNAAFGALDQALVASLTDGSDASTEALKVILLGHVLTPKVLDSKEITNGLREQTATPLATELLFTVTENGHPAQRNRRRTGASDYSDDKQISVGPTILVDVPSIVENADFPVTNGVLHKVNGVLSPVQLVLRKK